MFPRGTLLLPLLTCILLYCRCHAELTEEMTTVATQKRLTTLNDSMILSMVMVCTMFSVVLVLVPTVLYYRYCTMEEDDK